MKKFVLLSLILAILFTSLNVVIATAEPFGIALEEPQGESLIIGSNVDYKLNILLPENRSEYRNLFVTLRFGQGLDIINYNLNNGENIEGAGINVSASPSQKHDFITLKLSDIGKIPKDTNIVLQIGLKVNNDAKAGKTISNTYSYSYQLQNGTIVNAPQVQKQSKVVAGANQAPPVENPPVSPEQKPTFPVDKFSEGKTPLFMMTGSKYADFMNVVKGYTDPHAIVFVSYLSSKDDVETTQADSNGEFVIDLSNTSIEKPIVLIKAKSKDKEMSNEAVLTYIDQSTILYDDLMEFMNNLTILGKKDLTLGLMQRFNSLNLTQTVFMSVEPPRQMVYEAYRDLYKSAITGEVISGKNIQTTDTHLPYMKGYPEKNFIPQNPITRAEVAAIFSRVIAQAEVENKQCKFRDVEFDKWYSPYISHLTEIGLMKGYPEDGTFKPQRHITRAEFASLLVRYKNLIDIGPNNFKDLDDNYWAANDIRRASLAGLVKGYPEDGTFKPLNKVTRAEAATMINRALGRVPDKQYINSRNVMPFNDIKGHWAFYEIVEATVKHSPNMVNGREEGWKGNE